MLDKKWKISTNVPEAVEQAQKLFRSSDVLGDIAQSAKSLVKMGEASVLSTELEKSEARIAKLAFFETTTVWWNKEIMDEVERRHAEEGSVWEKTSRENLYSLINNEKAAKADIVRISIEGNFIQVHFGEHCVLYKFWSTQRRNGRWL